MAEEPMFIGPEDLPPEIREIMDKFLHEHLENGTLGEVTNDDLPAEVAAALRALQIRHQMVASGRQESAVDKIAASQEQLNLKTGDRCFMAAGVETVEAPGLTLLEIVDPTDYSGIFADWEDRILSGYMAAKYWTTENYEEEELGWFPRISLIPLPESWMWDEYWAYLKEGTLPNDPPEWLLQLIIKSVRGLADANSFPTPHPAACTSCSSTSVLFIAGERVEHKYMVGHPAEHPTDQTKYQTYARHGFDGERTATIVCLSCGFRDDLFARGAEIVINDKEAHHNS